MKRIHGARKNLQDAIVAIDALMSSDHVATVDSIDLNLLEKFRHELIAMLNSFEEQSTRNMVSYSGMGRAIVDRWPLPEETQADVELNAAVRKASEAVYAYQRAVK